MSTFEGTSPIFRSALRAAMETMQFQIAEMGKAETKFFLFQWSDIQIFMTYLF